MIDDQAFVGLWGEVDECVHLVEFLLLVTADTSIFFVEVAKLKQENTGIACYSMV